jgi:hypothetical protein
MAQPITSTHNMTITKIAVNLTRRRRFAYAGQKLIYEFDCVIGWAGRDTQPGFFHIFKKGHHASWSRVWRYSHALFNVLLYGRQGDSWNNGGWPQVLCWHPWSGRSDTGGRITRLRRV